MTRQDSQNWIEKIRSFIFLSLLATLLVACGDTNGFDDAPTDNGVVPSLTVVTMNSNNSNSDLAQAGDTITVTITADEAILAPTVLFNGNAATSVSGSGTNWVATYVASANDTDGSIGLTINYSDLAGNSGSVVTATTDSTSVSLDVEPKWQLAWADEFEGESLDANNWNIQTGDGCAEGICGWGNNEAQSYQEANVTVSGGMLMIQGRQEADDAYTSGRINTKEKLDIKYGRVEVNARLPEGQGTWPAIWMLPTDEVYGTWPLSGEIDIIEATNLGVDGKQTVTSTLHYGLPLPENSFTYSAYEPGFNPQDGFHTYAMEWEADEIRFFVDGVHHATQVSDNWYTYLLGEDVQPPTRAPFDQTFHLLLNLAIGGNLPGAPDPLALPQNYMVDYVRVYECLYGDADTGVGCSTGNPELMPIAAPGMASVQQMEIYTDEAPATISFSVADQTSTNTLQPGGFNAGAATIVSEFDFSDPANADNSVWHLAISGDVANAFLSSEDKTGDALLDTGFNFMGGQNLGELIFDMQVNSLSDGTNIVIKMDSGFPNVGQVVLESPAIGERQTYRVKISDLIANPAFVDCCGGTGLDLANVLNPFVIEPTNADAGAIEMDVYLDNIRVEIACKNEGDCSAGPKEKPVEILVVFDDSVGDIWDAGEGAGIGGFDDATGFATCFDGASCGDVVSWTIKAADEAERGQVIEFSHVVGDNFAGEIIAAENPQNLSAFDNGVLSFDIKVIDNGGNNGEFFMKVDCVFPCTSGDQAIGVVGANGWETVTISISQLIASGLDTSNVNTGLVIFPAGGQQSGVVYQIDNVFWNIEGTVGTPLSDNPPSTGVTIDGDIPVASGTDLNIYTDSFATGFGTSFFANDGTVNISEVDAADASYGKVIQIESLASMQVTWVQADPVLDVSSFAGGTLEFDMLVTQSPTDPAAFWQAKGECLGCTTIPELTVGGQTVITKDVWHHVSIDVDALAFADPTQVDKPLVLFPNWGAATGAIYQVDNLRLVVSSGSTPLSDDAPSAGVIINPSESTSGGMEELAYADDLATGYIFGQYDDDATGTTSIMTVDSMDATYGNVIEIKNGTASKVVSWVESNPTRDLSAYADGVLEFDMYVVDAPTSPDAIWKVKAECGAANCGAIELTIGGQTLLPPGQWHHIVVSVPSLAVTDLTTLKNVVIFNDWTQAAGSTYWVDNIVWKEIADTGSGSNSAKVLFDEALASGYSLQSYDDANTGTVSIVEIDSMDTTHGQVIEINNGTSPRVVTWLGNDAAEDLTAYASGTLSFDFYVVVPPTDTTADYRTKFENEPCPGACTSSVEIVFGDTSTIQAGQWYSFSLPLNDFAIPDITKIRNVAFFNAWEKAAGSVFQIDNVQINP